MDLRYQNAHGFLADKLIASWNALASLDRHSQAELQLMQVIPGALSKLPTIDEAIDVSVEIDFYWEDKNWVGRLGYKAAELVLWSSMCQEEGASRELVGQWQHTALKISASKGLEEHDPAHLWYWAECFARFVSACRKADTTASGCLVLISQGKELRIYAGNPETGEGDER